MTNKQAIEKLNDIRCHVKETSIEEQALVMAIEALKKAGIYGDIIYREDALMCLTGEYPADFKHDELIAKFIRRIRKLPSAQPVATDTNVGGTISRQAAIDAVNNAFDRETLLTGFVRSIAVRAIRDMPSAQPEQRYTEEELKVFQHGISLSLLSKRSSQHWCYDEDTATEIEFLEQLYEKVSADMRGETK